MDDVLHCSNCGAPITLPPGSAPEALVTCPFCGAQVEPAAAAPVQVSTSSTSSNVVVLQGAEGLKQLTPDQRARLQQALQVAERQIAQPYVSGEADVAKAPLSDWEPGLEPPARDWSALKLGLLVVAVLLVLAVVARMLGVPLW